MTYILDRQSSPLHRMVDTRVVSYGEEDYAAATARQWEANRQFIAMLNGYRQSGGLAQAGEVASMCNQSGACPLSLLADGVIKRDLISVDWQARIWIPLFQFNRPEMSMREGLRNVLAELVVVYNAWDVALWFSQPNPWLADNTPADTLANSAQDVLHAARAERFVATG